IMHETYNLKEKLKLFSMILLPILITQVSMYLMNFFDTVMAGRVGPADLAGVAIGSSLWVPIFTGINGVILALTPIIGQLAGAKETKDISKKVQQAIFLSVIMAIVVFLIGYITLNPVLQFMNLEEKVRHIAKYYLVSLS